MEHTFPVPEDEAHKLDEVKEELRQQPLLRRVADFFRANAGAGVVAAGLVGVLLAVWWKAGGKKRDCYGH